MGDSVTDCSRKRSAKKDGTIEGLGTGWVHYSHKTITSSQKDIQFWNRGYSGTLTRELLHQERWWPMDNELEINADVTTLMVGINDIWHPFWKNRNHDIAHVLVEFEKVIETLKSRSSTLVVGEPIALPCGEVTQQWWMPLDELTKGQAQICKEHDVYWWPLQESIMSDAHGKSEEYLSDGVHPTDLGHRWLSRKWLNFMTENQLFSR
jgi:lysophospholipase L1-like esterase